MHKCVNKSIGNVYHLEQMVGDFFPYSQEKLKFDQPVTIIFQGDKDNSMKMLGKTAYYDPSNLEVVLYVDGRHPKDVLRSLSHELVHHAQNCRGDFKTSSGTDVGYAQRDPHLRAMEREAYTKGNLIFRDFEDLIKTGKIFVDIDFKKSGEPKMALHEWKNKELNDLLMEHWGFSEKNEGLADEFEASAEAAEERGPRGSTAEPVKSHVAPRPTRDKSVGPGRDLPGDQEARETPAELATRMKSGTDFKPSLVTDPSQPGYWKTKGGDRPVTGDGEPATLGPSRRAKPTGAEADETPRELAARMKSGEDYKAPARPADLSVADIYAKDKQKDIGSKGLHGVASAPRRGGKGAGFAPSPAPKRTRREKPDKPPAHLAQYVAGTPEHGAASKSRPPAAVPKPKKKVSLSPAQKRLYGLQENQMKIKERMAKLREVYGASTRTKRAVEPGGGPATIGDITIPANPVARPSAEVTDWHDPEEHYMGPSQTEWEYEGETRPAGYFDKEVDWEAPVGAGPAELTPYEKRADAEMAALAASELSDEELEASYQANLEESALGWLANKWGKYTGYDQSTKSRLLEIDYTRADAPDPDVPDPDAPVVGRIDQTGLSADELDDPRSMVVSPEKLAAAQGEIEDPDPDETWQGATARGRSPMGGCTWLGPFKRCGAAAEV